MPELIDRKELFTSKSLLRREVRQQRRIQLTRLTHRGKTLAALEQEEKTVLRHWAEAEGIPDLRERASVLCTLERCLDIIRERRRIIIGEPLPGSRRPGGRPPWQTASVLDVKPVVPVQIAAGEQAEHPAG
ncbi:MAG TPA: hypothetical protein PKM73_20175 [Verrucomicrobiota bacterium]|nr:hypothetical protein [Verrucomicrobiota bacterium]